MRKLIYLLACFFAAVCLLPSCSQSRYIYSASTPNNPYFKKKGDSKIAAYYAGDPNFLRHSGGFNQGYDFQSGYAVSNHWALTLDYYTRQERNVYAYNEFHFPDGPPSSYDSSIVNYKRHITSFGAGYFMFINPAKTVSLNVYGGVGFGNFSINDNTFEPSSAVDFYKSNLTKFYIQPSINLMDVKYFSASFISKVSFVHYSDISTSYDEQQLQIFTLDKMPNSTIIFFEPTVNMQFMPAHRFQWIKIETSFTLVSNSQDQYAPHRVFNGALGLSFDLSKIKKKPQQ